MKVWCIILLIKYVRNLRTLKVFSGIHHEKINHFINSNSLSIFRFFSFKYLLMIWSPVDLTNTMITHTLTSNILFILVREVCIDELSFLYCKSSWRLLIWCIYIINKKTEKLFINWHIKLLHIMFCTMFVSYIVIAKIYLQDTQNIWSVVCLSTINNML